MSQLEAVSSSWSTKLGAMIWTAVPIWAKRAASYRTCGLIRATLGALGLGQLHQLSFPGLVGAVSSSCSTVDAIRTAHPIFFRAASKRARSLIPATLSGLGLGHLHQRDPLVCKRAFGSSGCASRPKIIRAAIPIGFRAASTRARGLVRATLRGLAHQLDLFGLNLETTGQCHKGKDHPKNFHLGQCTVFFSPQN